MTLLLLSWACSSNPIAAEAPPVPSCEPFHTVLADTIEFNRRVSCSAISVSVEHTDYASAEPQWRDWLTHRNASIATDDSRPGFTQIGFEDTVLGTAFLSIVEQPARATATLTVRP